MKIIFKLFIFCILLSSCADMTTEQSSLGEYGQFFEKQTRLRGGPAVKIVSKSPKSITIRFKRVYIDLAEATNAAQFHCQKNSTDAVLNKEEYFDGAVTQAYFECK